MQGRQKMGSAANTVLGVAARGAAAVVAATSNATPLAADSLSPTPAANTKRKVVLHQDHGHQHLPHNLEVEFEISLVIILVVVHLGALCFWAWLLYASKGSKGSSRQSHTQKTNYGVTVDSSGSPSKGRNRSSTLFSSGHTAEKSEKPPEKPSAALSWRTPGEILASRKQAEKERLGKV